MKHIFIQASFAWRTIQSPIREWEFFLKNSPLYAPGHTTIQQTLVIQLIQTWLDMH